MPNLKFLMYMECECSVHQDDSYKLLKIHDSREPIKKCAFKKGSKSLLHIIFVRVEKGFIYKYLGTARKFFASANSVWYWNGNEFRSDILWKAHLPWMFYRSSHFYCRNKANSDSLLMAYYIVTFLASSWLHSSKTHSSGTGTRALSNLGIEQSHRFSRRSRLSLQAIIASSLVMMDNGGASIKIRPEQYLSEWKAHSRTCDGILDAPPRAHVYIAQ